jgi:hypothetical protein
MYCRVVTLKWTDVSEVRTASITRAMMEAERTSQTSVHFNVTTQRYIPEDPKLKATTFVSASVYLLSISLQVLNLDSRTT